MKKLMLLAALLAMLIVAAVPAIAQIGQEGEQETESGEVDQSFSVTSEGDNCNQCAGIQGVANTGNAQNQIDLIQYGSDGGRLRVRRGRLHDHHEPGEHRDVRPAGQPGRFRVRLRTSFTGAGHPFEGDQPGFNRREAGPSGAASFYCSLSGPRCPPAVFRSPRPRLECPSIRL